MEEQPDVPLAEFIARNLTAAEIITAVDEFGGHLEPEDRRQRKETLIAKVVDYGHGVLLLNTIRHKREVQRQERQVALSEQQVRSRELRREARAQVRSAELELLKVGSSKRPLNNQDDSLKFMDLPSQHELGMLYSAFYNATAAAALKHGVCAVCGHRDRHAELGLSKICLKDLPNRHLLRASRSHHANDLVLGYMLILEACSPPQADNESMIHLDVCKRCLGNLRKHTTKPPKFSLANSLWLGQVPWQLQCLTLPEAQLIARLYPRAMIVKLYPKDKRNKYDPTTLYSGLQGNITTYDFNMEAIADMVDGRLMPQRPRVLADIISVTYVGIGSLPKNWLMKTFRVCRHHVGEALIWLKNNNRKYYGDIQIDSARMQELPEDDVPVEIMANIRQEQSEGLAAQEKAGYGDNGSENDEDSNGEILQFSYHGKLFINCR